MAVPRLVTLILALTATASAHGVMPSPDGKGQVLIYPYYTVRGSGSAGGVYNTLLSIVNTTILGKAVKLRVHEGRAGAPVFEANVFLSAKDVWTGAIVPAEPGTGLISRDASCVQPAVPPDSQGRPVAAGRFTNAAYAGDPLGASIDRVDEGFVEVIEMGTVPWSTQLAPAITHVAGVAHCALGSDGLILADLAPPTGGLYGNATLVSVQDGTAYGYDATALVQWSDVVAYGAAGSGTPTLAQASPPVSVVVDGAKLYTSTWATGLEAVQAVLMANGAEAEFMREKIVDGATDVVVTTPTRHLAVDGTRASPPFREPLTARGACERVDDGMHSRDERMIDLDPNAGDLTSYGALCWSSTVWSHKASDATPPVIGSTAPFRQFIADWHEQLPVAQGPYPSGVVVLRINTGEWLERSMTAALPTFVFDRSTGVASSVAGVTYHGLPMLGVGFVRYVNGALDVAGTRTLSNYGTTGALRVHRAIVLP